MRSPVQQIIRSIWVVALTAVASCATLNTGLVKRSLYRSPDGAGYLFYQGGGAALVFTGDIEEAYRSAYDSEFGFNYGGCSDGRFLCLWVDERQLIVSRDAANRWVKGDVSCSTDDVGTTIDVVCVSPRSPSYRFTYTYGVGLESFTHQSARREGEVTAYRHVGGDRLMRE
jgi:hypothetical protein